MRFCEGKRAIIFNARIPAPMIIINLISIQSLQKALEMIETMPVMPADRGTEHARQLTGVFFVTERLQQSFALSQDFRHSILQRRSVHR